MPLAWRTQVAFWTWTLVFLLLYSNIWSFHVCNKFRAPTPSQRLDETSGDAVRSRMDKVPAITGLTGHLLMAPCVVAPRVPALTAMLPTESLRILTLQKSSLKTKETNNVGTI